MVKTRFARVLGLGLGGAAGAALLGRWFLGLAGRQTMYRFMTEPYDKNQVTRDDLFALDRVTAEIAGIPCGCFENWGIGN